MTRTGLERPREGKVRAQDAAVAEARGELFKWASNDDLYGRDLLKRCIEAMDSDPRIVLSHSYTAMIDGSLTIIPLPCAYTRVLAVPRSIARSLEKSEKIDRILLTREVRVE